MTTLEIEIRNPSGLHARPAALFVRTAAGFRSRITIENVSRATAPVDAKSIIAMLTTGVSRGHLVRLAADGEDEEAAITTLEQLIRDGIGEAVE